MPLNPNNYGFRLNGEAIAFAKQLRESTAFMPLSEIALLHGFELCFYPGIDRIDDQRCIRLDAFDSDEEQRNDFFAQIASIKNREIDNEFFKIVPKDIPWEERLAYQLTGHKSLPSHVLEYLTAELQRIRLESYRQIHEYEQTNHAEVEEEGD